MRLRPPALLLHAATAIGLAACVTVVSSEPLQPEIGTAVVVPLPGGQGRTGLSGPLDEFYAGILERMHEAYGRPDRERPEPADLPALRGLLHSYQRPDAPAWARERMAMFAALVPGVAFELHAARHSKLVLPEPVPPLGATLALQLQLPAMPDAGLVLGGEHDAMPIGFRLHVAIDDRFADGSARGHESWQVLRLPQAFVLAGEAVLQLPIELQVPANAAVVRNLEFRVDLLPGFVGTDGEPAGVRRTHLCSGRLQQHPEGFAAVQQRPLLTLREAMRIGDVAHFPHVFLAATCMPAGDRDTANELLIQWVRLGQDDQAIVAMAALRELTGQPFAIGDRQRWLAWWSSRR